MPVMKKYAKNNLSLKNWKDTHKLHRWKVWDNSGILTFSGAQGSGKSLTAVKYIRDCLKDYPDLTVMSNQYLFGIDYIPFSLEALVEFDKSGKFGLIIYIDEASNEFPNTDKINPVFAEIINMLDKRECLCILTLPVWSRVSKLWREQMDTLVLCKRSIFGIQLNHWYKFDVEALNDDLDTQDKMHGLKHIKTQYFFHSLEDYGAYNTKSLVSHRLDKLKECTQ